MKKMPTLFNRTFDNHTVIECSREPNPGCEWVLNGEGYATEKRDGTCCLIENGKIYRRYDFKPGRKLPEGAIPCQEAADLITGHFPHWLLCKEGDPQCKYHLEAFRKKDAWENGTYELIGVHFQSNPYNLNEDILERHGSIVLEDVPRSYEGLKQYLHDHYIEGIVFYRGNGEMVKIKRKDFGFPWNRRHE